MTYAICFLLGLLVGLAFLCFLRGADTRATEETEFMREHYERNAREFAQIRARFAEREACERLYDRQGIL